MVETTRSDPDLPEQFASVLTGIVNQADKPENRPQLLAQLKSQADLHWGREPRVSFLFASLMIALGELTSDQHAVALGMMSKGDSLRFINRIGEAHATLEEAGHLFQLLGDEVGWARTRIGRLLTSQEIGAEAIRQALADVDRARKIFVRQQEIELLVRLSINLSAFHEWRSEFQQARAALLFAIDLIDEADRVHHARLLHNLGILEQADGDYGAALDCYKRAETLFLQAGQSYEVARVAANRASLWMLQGNYRQALHLMQTIQSQLDPLMQLTNGRNQIICYQLLGAHHKARLEARQLLETNADAPLLDKAAIHMYLGESLAELADYQAAIHSFNHAETILRLADASELLYEAHVRRADTYLNLGEVQAAIADAQYALASADLYVIARANLVLGQTALQADRLQAAHDFSLKAHTAARKLGMELLRYRSSILLGGVREAGNQFEKAVFHYRQANRRVLKIQHQLSRDYRPGYLERTQEAFHNLIRIALRQGQIDQAFGTLEEIKSTVVQQQLLERRSATISDHDRFAEIEQRLKLARAQYLELIDYGRNSPNEVHHQEKRRLEQMMTDILAEARLHRPTEFRDLPVPTVDDVRATLLPGTGLVEYYSDGEQVYAFTLAPHTDLKVIALDRMTYMEINTVLRLLQRCIGRALAVGVEDAIPLYLAPAHLYLRRLYEALILPCRDFMARYESVVIVPFGILHLIPFHLLYDGTSYLVERQQLTTQPASGYRRDQQPMPKAGLLALGYNDGHAAYRMEKEAARVAEILEGDCFVGAQAVSQQLSASCCQVLHIAAHGKHNLNQPRLSHLRLADGFLFMEDLWQFDLEYELVMLSACSVGLSHPSGGDELIGLGHSFLYAGAAAMVSSLWDVDDAAAEAFTNGFYGGLRKGLSKAEAMQRTQTQLMHDSQFGHPAYWGAFQLLGSPAPLQRIH